MAGKAKRLNKAAKEYNVSISTIVDFLATKGFEIDSKPNTKIEGYQSQNQNYKSQFPTKSVDLTNEGCSAFLYSP